MNENFNRQFIILDFKHLDDPAYLDFVGTPEYKVFLILMRYVWRGGTHRLGLDELHLQKKLLVTAIQRDFIANKLGLKEETHVSRYLKRLEDMKVVQRMRTGRESIFVMGEWIDISEENDGSAKKEWFYYERVFGKSRNSDSSKETRKGSDEESFSDMSPDDTSEVPNSTHQILHEPTHQMWPLATPSNINNKINNKNVNVNAFNKEEKNKMQADQVQDPDKIDLRDLPDINQPKEKTKFIASEISAQLVGDSHSKGFHYLVAAKVPEHEIRKALSEIKHGSNVEAEGAVFTYHMKNYAARVLGYQIKKDLFSARSALAESKKLS